MGQHALFFKVKLWGSFPQRFIFVLKQSVYTSKVNMLFNGVLIICLKNIVGN